MKQGAPFVTKRILLTGGCGFIGSHLIRYLLGRYPDRNITNLDLLCYAGNPDNLLDVQNHPNYRFVHGDIRNEQLADELVKDADIVINAAAQTHVDRSISGPAVFTSTNVLGTQVLLEAARRHNIEKFVQVSTDEVYGSIEGDGLFTEESPVNPSSPYSASKAGADMLALSYWRTYNFPVCITRCSNNYGPNQYPEKLIPLFIANASQGKPVPVYGDGLNVRDWIHVADHAAAVAAVVEEGAPGEVYNIGTNNERTNLEITRLILSILNQPESLIEFVTDRPGHDRRYAIDSGKIRRELGWRPVTEFSKGLEETVKWYLDNPGWIAGVRKREKALVSVS